MSTAELTQPPATSPGRWSWWCHRQGPRAGRYHSGSQSGAIGPAAVASPGNMEKCEFSAPRPAGCETIGGPWRRQKGREAAAKPAVLSFSSAIKSPGQPPLGQVGRIFEGRGRDIWLSFQNSTGNPSAGKPAALEVFLKRVLSKRMVVVWPQCSVGWKQWPERVLLSHPPPSPGPRGPECGELSREPLTT